MAIRNYSKYVVAVVVLILFAIIAAHVARDLIALQAANLFLKESDIEVSEVSGSSIGPTLVTVSKVVADIGASSRVEIDGITLPTNFNTATRRDISAKRVVFTTSNDSGPPASISDNLRAYLDLHEISPNTRIRIDALEMPPGPSIKDVDWSTTPTASILRARIGDYSFIFTVAISTEEKNAEFRLEHDERGVATSAVLNIIEESDAVRLEGDVHHRLVALIPLMRAIDILPTGLTALRADFDGTMKIHLPNNAAESVAIDSAVDLDSKITFDYAPDENSKLIFSAEAETPVNLRVIYPGLEWSASISSASSYVTFGELRDQPVQFSAIECRSGISCLVTLSGDLEETAIGKSSFSAARFNLPIAVTIDENTRFDIGKDSGIQIRDFRAGSLRTALLDISRPESGRIELHDAGWSASAEAMNLALEGLSPTPNARISGEIRVSKMLFEETNAHTRFNASMTMDDLTTSFNDIRLSDLSIASDVLVEDDDLDLQLRLSTQGGELRTDIDMDGDLASATARISLEKASLNLGDTPLSSLLQGWPYSIDLSAGRFELTGSFQLEEDGISGDAALVTDQASGAYEDIAFVGFDSTVVMNLDKNGGLSTQPGAFSLSLLDAGIRAKDISGLASISDNGSVIDVRQLKFKVLGGTIDVDPFMYVDSKHFNSIVLQADGLQLSQIADFAELASFDVDGGVSGEIPIRIGDDGITITDGILESDGKGGSIRYIPAVMNEDAHDASEPQSQLDIVTRSLGHFEFSSLISEISYSNDGNLNMKTRLTGINPDVDPTQPIVLNLNIENNIPQLLRSLQATRSIEQILEQRSAH